MLQSLVPPRWLSDGGAGELQYLELVELGCLCEMWGFFHSAWLSSAFSDPSPYVGNGLSAKCVRGI